MKALLNPKPWKRLKFQVKRLQVTSFRHPECRLIRQGVTLSDCARDLGNIVYPVYLVSLVCLVYLV